MPDGTPRPEEPAIVFRTFTIPEVMLWAAPPVIVAGMALLFSGLGDLIGRKRGYLAGFVFYWAFFCYAFPLLVLGPGVLGTLRPAPLPPGRQGPALVLALLLPPAFAGATVFRTRVRSVTPAILLASAALALVNGLGEELLWRGAYVHAFPDNAAVAIAFPAVGFALWHLAPLILRPTRQRGGTAAFVGASLLFGVVWGWAAFATGSIALTTVSHVAADFLGLGGFAYFGGRATEGEDTPPPVI